MRIQIIDFNVFGPPTEALLFQWSELENDVHENVSLINANFIVYFGLYDSVVVQTLVLRLRHSNTNQ